MGSIFRVRQRGSFKNTDRLLKIASSKGYLSRLNELGALGVSALALATPYETGETAASWSFVIEKTSESVSIKWINNVYAGVTPKVILLQYGHATRQGGYVEGRDFINPAMAPVFDMIEAELFSAAIHS